MVELTPEEERSLKELVEAYRRGESVKGFINNRLYEELSHKEPDEEGVLYSRKYLPGFDEQRQVYAGLLEKGMISGSKPDHRISPSYGFGNLTSEGRCYFEMKEAARKAERSKVWSSRRFQIGLSVFTLLLSAAISIAISLYLNHPLEQASNYQQAQQLAQGNAQRAGDGQDEEAAPV